MNNSVFETVEKSSQVLRLDFSSIEFAKLAEEQELTEAQIQAVAMVFEHLQQKKIETTIHTLLKMSRLPLKDPKTFENFDFSIIKGRDAAKLKTLPSLSAIYAHRNLAFIGPAGTGKTHLAQAFGYECCQRGIKTYFIKMSELRDLKLRVDFSDEERFEGYEKHVQWTQKLIDQIDSVWPTLPPYNHFVQPHQMHRNKLRVCLTRFSDMLDGDRAANPLAGLEFDEDDDEEYISTTVKFVPIDMDWYWTDGNSQYAMDNQRRMKELNQAIEDLMQPYIHWVEDVLRVKCCYEKLLSDFLHIKHGFLTEADLAKQFAAYFKTESMAGTAHRKLNGPAPLTSCHEVFTPVGGAPFLCASYDFDRLGAFLYEDFFRGLAEHFIPKRCGNCGTWFLIDASIYSDYCENPLAEDKTKTCRMVSARKKYDTKCKEDPIWNIYNKAYKAHYARIAKKKMTKAEFEAWSRYAVELREQA